MLRKTRLESLVEKRFGITLYEFIKHRIEIESLYDYEIANILSVSSSTITKYRDIYGIKKANAFYRRFELKYGKGAIEKFKKIIEEVEYNLTTVANYFGFSREYARQVYKKIYGLSYAEAHRKTFTN